jgi:hypothetical protein
VETYCNSERSGGSFVVPVCFRLESMLALICSGLGEAGGPPTGEVCSSSRTEVCEAREPRRSLGGGTSMGAGEAMVLV